MRYRIETTARFDKEFKKLDQYTNTQKATYIKDNIIDTE